MRRQDGRAARDANGSAAPMATCPDEADWDLVIDVLDVLDKYGYRNAGEPYTGRAVVLVRTLARVYSGMSE